jgi:hypothetical protein
MSLCCDYLCKTQAMTSSLTVVGKATDGSCQHCGQPLSGRIDKRFCDDYCRSNFHNRLNSQSTLFMRHTHRLLRGNRRILAAFAQAGRTRLPREELLRAGFRFNFFTSQHHQPSGLCYRFCYEYGYAADEAAGEVILVKMEEPQEATYAPQD